MKNKAFYGLLVLSLAANVFLVGVMIGRGFDGHKDTRPPPPPADFNMRALSQYLNEEQRTLLFEGLRSQRETVRANVRGLRQNEEKIRAVLMAENVDKKVLEQLLQEHEHLIQLTRSPLTTIISDVVANFDWETRKALAVDLFKRRAHRGPGRPPHERRFGPPPHERDGFGRPRRERRPPPEGGETQN